MITQPSVWGALVDAANNSVFAPALISAGAPTNGTSGSGAGLAGPGCLLIDITNKNLYINSNTKASPTWTQIGSGGGGGAVTLDGVQTLTNKILGNTNTLEPVDNKFTIDNHTDATKQVAFDVSGITTGTKRTVTVPDADITLVGVAATQTLTNKTLTAPVIGAATGTSVDLSGDCKAASYHVGATAGVSAGPFTAVSSITVVNGIVTALTGT